MGSKRILNTTGIATVEKTLFIRKEELGFMIEQIGVLGKELKLLIMKLLLTSLQEIH